MQHPDILDEPEPLRRPFFASVVLHLSGVGLIALGSWVGFGATERWGARDQQGGAIGVTPVASIPMPVRDGLRNPVANDTQSRVPQPPPDKKKAEPKEKESDRKAIEIQDKKAAKKKERERPTSLQRYRVDPEERPNQLYTESGQALVSPMIGKAGSGGIGIGSGSPLGDRFGAYAALIQQRVAQSWNTQDIDARLRTAPPAVVTFAISRNGEVGDVRLRTSSGNRQLDVSAQRAVYDVGRFPPLPAGYSGSQANIELWFHLKR